MSGVGPLGRQACRGGLACFLAHKKCLHLASTRALVLMASLPPGPSRSVMEAGRPRMTSRDCAGLAPPPVSLVCACGSQRTLAPTFPPVTEGESCRGGCDLLPAAGFGGDCPSAGRGGVTAGTPRGPAEEGALPTFCALLMDIADRAPPLMGTGGIPRDELGCEVALRGVAKAWATKYPDLRLRLGRLEYGVFVCSSEKGRAEGLEARDAVQVVSEQTAWMLPEHGDLVTRSVVLYAHEYTSSP